MTTQASSASPLDIPVRGWRPVETELPDIGQKCLICIGGIVQHEVYEFDCYDTGDLSISYFWSRDDVDDCPDVKSGHLWMPLPDAPNVEIRGGEAVPLD